VDTSPIRLRYLNIECGFRVRHLRDRDEHGGDRISIHPGIPGITHNADNLPERLAGKRPTCTRRDLHAVAQRIAFGPILPRHCLVDDNDPGSSSLVLRGEDTAAQQRNLKACEVAL
jgi:hypothetical protein